VHSRVRNKTRARTRFHLGQVRVKPAGANLHPHPHPSGPKPTCHPKPEPELPSLEAIKTLPLGKQHAWLQRTIPAIQNFATTITKKFVHCKTFFPFLETTKFSGLLLLSLFLPFRSREQLRTSFDINKILYFPKARTDTNCYK
jgi:hypothetical protein